MPFFDAAKPWVILVPPDTISIKKTIEDFAGCLELLRKKSGISRPVTTMAQDTPIDSSLPVIICNITGGTSAGGGFSWRAGPERIEFFGSSPRGFTRAVYGFLKALGFTWPSPEEQVVPDPDPGSSNYPLTPGSGYVPDEEHPAKLKRLVLARDLPVRQLEKWFLWGIRNSFDAVVVPFGKSRRAGPGKVRYREDAVFRKITQYGFLIENGGWELSRLVPRNRFILNRELFRMSEGRRKKRIHFCPTNPDTIRLLQREAGKIFERYPRTKVFHLWPEKEHETVWCNCPSCRAFSQTEQIVIAVNAAADVLEKIRPDSSITYYEPDIEANDIKPRHTMVALHFLPGSRDGEKEGWYFTGS